MSIDMYVDKSKNQATKLSEVSKDISQGYDDVQQAISEFVGDHMLKGKAYDSARQFFSTVISPLALSMKTLSELTEQACNEFVSKYQTEVDSQSLKESELEEDIHKLALHITKAKNLNDSLKKKASDNIGAITGNIMIIANLEQQKKELEEKLRKLREFDDNSTNIFKEVEGFQKNVEQGLNLVKTSWDPIKQTFNIPKSKDMEWAKVSQQKALELEMKKVELKLNDDKKLGREDLSVVMSYAEMHPEEEMSQSLKDYLIENNETILRDFSMDLSTHLIEQAGVGVQRFGVMLNTYGGVRGPEGPNSFVQITNTAGNKAIKQGELVSKIGKVGGKGAMGLGLGLGMYDDLYNDDKTVGEAVAHNTLTMGSGAVLSAGLGLLLSNPIGWGALGLFAIGTATSIGVDYLYKNNILGIKDGTDWVGHQLDNVFDKYIDFQKKKFEIEVKGITYAKEQIQKGYGKVSEGIEKNIGEAFDDVKNAVNPMKWSW